MLLRISFNGIPVRTPTYIAMMMRETKALILSFNTMNNNRSTAESTVKIIKVTDMDNADRFRQI